jgi:sec-independent protein translocase protein TatC
MAKIRKSRDPANCVMSLGDHLEELRARLILAILGLSAGAILSMFFGFWILHFLERPYKAAMEQWSAKKEIPRAQTEALSFVRAFFDKLTSDPNVAIIDPARVAYLRAVSEEAVKDWVQQTRGVGGTSSASHRDGQLTVLSPAEVVTAYFKISLIAGLILTAPWVFYQIWAFVAAGLYPKERAYVYRAVPFSAGLFITGALFFLFGMAKITLLFFLQFGDWLGVASMWTFQRYISFVCVTMLVFGLAFQTPIVVFILVRTGIVSIQTLRKHRGPILLGLAFASALCAPSPDVASMMMLLVPLYALYEIGILLSVFAEKKAKKQAEAEAPQT